MRAAAVQAGAEANAASPNGITPLHIAARAGVVGVCDSLVAAGANVDARTR